MQSLVSIGQEMWAELGKNSFAVFAILRKKILDANGRGLCQKMQQTPVNMCVQVFQCGRFGVGVIAPNAFSLGIAPPSVRRVWILSSA